MVTVREVETSNVHASVKHFNEHVNVPAGGAKGADNLGLALGEIDALKDVLELDAGGVGRGGFRVYHSLFSVCFLKCLDMSVLYLYLFAYLTTYYTIASKPSI